MYFGNAVWAYVIAFIALLGGGVPGAHVEGNGVAVGSVGCFYSYKPKYVKSISNFCATFQSPIITSYSCNICDVFICYF